MQKWESLVMDVSDPVAPDDEQNIIDHHGRFGWELAGARSRGNAVRYYFKRSLPEEK